MYCPYCIKQIADNLSNCPYCKQDVRIENSPFQLPIETILAGRYYVGKAIGQGGFGITYVCCDLKLQMRVAIKEYFPQGIVGRISTYSTQLTVSGEEQRTLFAAQKERFLLEARILAEFAGDSHIVRISDIFSENNTTYIVMEYVEGITLDEYVKQHGTMSFSAVFRMLKPIMNTLGAIHEKGLIHRDISPANIIISSKGEAKLLDFGAARSYAGQEQSISVILKPGYAPFEQYSSHGSQGPWTDIYALCATIYKSITGLVPKNSFERMKNDDLAYPTYLKADISEMEEAVLMRGMAVQSEDRFHTMKELLSAFSDAAHGKASGNTTKYLKNKTDTNNEKNSEIISKQINEQFDDVIKLSNGNNKSLNKLHIVFIAVVVISLLTVVLLYNHLHYSSNRSVKKKDIRSETNINNIDNTSSDIEDLYLKVISDYTNNLFADTMVNSTYENFIKYTDEDNTIVSKVFDNDWGNRWKQFREMHGNVVYAKVDLTQHTAEGNYSSRIILKGEDGEQMAFTVTYDKRMIPIISTICDYSNGEELPCDPQKEKENLFEIREENIKEVYDYTQKYFADTMLNSTYEIFAQYKDEGNIVVSETFDNDWGYRWKEFADKHGHVITAKVDFAEQTVEDNYKCRIILTGDDDKQMAFTVTYDKAMIPVSTVIYDYSNGEELPFDDEKENKKLLEIRQENIKDIKMYTQKKIADIMSGSSYEDFVKHIEDDNVVFTRIFDQNWCSRWKEFVDEHGEVVDAKVELTQYTEEGNYTSLIILSGEDSERMAFTITYDMTSVPISTVIQNC